MDCIPYLTVLIPARVLAGPCGFLRILVGPYVLLLVLADSREFLRVLAGSCGLLRTLAGFVFSELVAMEVHTVSYTHLTLPTKRIV